jgi:acyl carrier protein
MSTTGRVIEIMAAAFGLPSDRIGGSASMETLSEWDSVSHLSLVIGLEEAFGISFDPDEVPVMTSLQAILETLRRHGVVEPGGSST